MPRYGLHPDVALSVHLDAICCRNQYTSAPGPVVDEITRVAGARTAVRDETVGVWAGFYRDEHTATLCDALRTAFPGARDHEHVGVRRRGGIHSTGDYAR